jgi:hypothetical protein
LKVPLYSRALVKSIQLKGRWENLQRQPGGNKVKGSKRKIDRSGYRNTETYRETQRHIEEYRDRQKNTEADGERQTQIKEYRDKRKITKIDRRIQRQIEKDRQIEEYRGRQRKTDR